MATIARELLWLWLRHAVVRQRTDAPTQGTEIPSTTTTAAPLAPANNRSAVSDAPPETTLTASKNRTLFPGEHDRGWGLDFFGRIHDAFSRGCHVLGGLPRAAAPRSFIV
jgi:hypothetical protein